MALHGRNASIKLNVGVDTITDLYNWSIDITSDPIEQPVFGDIWSKTHGLAVNKWSGSFEGIYDKDDTNGQVALRQAQLSSTVISGIRFYMDTTTSYYYGDAWITSHSVSTDPEDVVRVTYTFNGTEELTLV